MFSKVTNNPVASMNGEDFKQYSDAIIAMDMSTLNVNTCNKERKTENPYVTYRLVKEHEIYGSNAEFRVLKFWHSPKSLQRLDEDNTSRVFTAVKSDATYGNWELGDMYFKDLARLIHLGYVVEHQRTMEFSLYEWRLAVYHRSMADESLSLEESFNDYRSDIVGIIDKMKKNGMSYDEVVKNIGGVDPDSSMGTNFYYNKNLEEHLEFLSQSFFNSSENEVSLLLKFMNNVICNYKGKHLKELEKRGIEVTPERIRHMAEPQDIVNALHEEIRDLKRAMDLTPGLFKKDGENVGQA